MKKQTKLIINEQILSNFPVEQIDNFDEYIKSNRYIGVDFLKRDYKTLKVMFVIIFCFITITLSAYFFLILTKNSIQTDLSKFEEILMYLKFCIKCILISFSINIPIAIFIVIFLIKFLKKCPKCKSYNMYHQCTDINEIKTQDYVTTTTTTISINNTTNNTNWITMKSTNAIITDNIIWKGHAFICRKKDCCNKIFDVKKIVINSTQVLTDK